MHNNRRQNAKFTQEDQIYLIQRMNAGDEEARQLLIQQVWLLMMAALKRFDKTADDVPTLDGKIQYVLDSYDGTRNKLSALVNTVVLNEIRQKWRKDKALVKHKDWYEDGLPRCTSPEIYEVIKLEHREHLINKMWYYMLDLTPNQQHALVEYGMKGRAQEDVAKDRGVSRSCISSYYKIALQKLQTKMAATLNE